MTGTLYALLRLSPSRDRHKIVMNARARGKEETRRPRSRSRERRRGSRGPAEKAETTHATAGSAKNVDGNAGRCRFVSRGKPYMRRRVKSRAQDQKEKGKNLRRSRDFTPGAAPFAVEAQRGAD